MKTSKFLTALVCMFALAFTSCQDEIDSENGDNPNTNSANSTTASNLERSAMYDGSFDDFLDGMSCSSVLLPVTATVNNTQVTLISESDYSLVLDIIGEFTNDDDSVVFQFPITVRLSNYTEVIVTNQSEFDELMEACETAEDEAESAINCLDIDFPITILTYDANIEQTGSVVIESEQQLYAYMNNFDDAAFFSVNYPITATLNSDTVVEITSDADLEAQIIECIAMDDDMEDAEDQAEDIESILIEGVYTIDAFVTAGVDTANEFSDYTLNFANDLTITAVHTTNSAISEVNGTYEVASELDVFISLTFSENANFELLNNTWEVTSYSENTISLQSTTNAAVTLVLAQI
ncbi:hypothetical protein ITJ86_11090 [Winogradskyella sp. F6397]|uniref:Lipocalin-like domain-containing protein n=1 Tax=Winogradskyella marina TaxID=2785530 RepID=A0ABS0EJ72_9FLAO|nr:hypothetical protein [Winogradskyella marina]MBF8150444.1 hypothetical protein [Winogradskyella marina]